MVLKWTIESNHGSIRQNMAKDSEGRRTGDYHIRGVRRQHGTSGGASSSRTNDGNRESTKRRRVRMTLWFYGGVITFTAGVIGLLEKTL